MPHIVDRGYRAVVTVVVMVFVLLLSGCGLVIDTNLRLDSTESGVRVMTVNVPVSTIDSGAQGGIDGVNESIALHLPEGLDYAGYDVVDDSYVFTFEVQFSSLDEYRQTLKRLVNASTQGATPPTPTVEITDSRGDDRLVSGVVVRENITSTDLLGWLTAGLVADHVIEPSVAQSFTLLTGTTHLTYDTVDYDFVGVIDYESIDDNGVESVEISLTDLGTFPVSGHIEIGIGDAITYAHREAIENYVYAHAADYLQLDTNENSSTFILQFNAEDADELSDLLNTVLGSQSNRVDVKSSLSDDPFTVLTEARLHLDCSAICSPQGQGIRLITPSATDTPVDPNISHDGEQMSTLTADYQMRWSHPVTFTDVQLATSFSHDRVSQAVTFVLPKNTDSAFVNDLADALGSAHPNISVDSRLKPESAVVELRFSADDDAQLADQLREILPAVDLTVTEESNGLFRSITTYRLSILTDLAEEDAQIDHLEWSIDAGLTSSLANTPGMTRINSHEGSFDLSYARSSTMTFTRTTVKIAPLAAVSAVALLAVSVGLWAVLRRRSARRHATVENTLKIVEPAGDGEETVVLDSGDDEATQPLKR